MTFFTKEVDPSTPPAFNAKADLIALGVFGLMLIGYFGYWFRHDYWLNEYDVLTYFMPWYGQLGDILRSGDLPRWMPWLSAGSPQAGDPSGGWWYLPAMAVFPFFWVTTAFKTMIVIQSIIGGLAIYGFSRMVRLRPVSALLAVVAFVFGPYLAAQMSYGTVAGQANTWIPVALFAVECGLRRRSWFARVAWLGLAGFAISQIAVAWPGQGLYNASLFIAAWIAYRCLLWPLDVKRSLPGRLIDLISTGCIAFVFGGLLSAAGLLPRLSVNADSNIPGGDYSQVIGGDYLVSPNTWLSLLRESLLDSSHSRVILVSASVAVLGLFAMLTGRGKYGVPFFASVIVLAGLMTLDHTPLHTLLYVLPGFEHLHTHSPRRLLWILFMAPAMLAGAGLESALAWKPRRRSLALAVLPIAILLLTALLLNQHHVWIGWWQIADAVIVTIIVLTVGVIHQFKDPSFERPVTRLAALAAIALVFVFPAFSDLVGDIASPPNSAVASESCLETALSRTDPGGAGEFLQQKQQESGPFRIVSYAGRDPLTHDSSYSNRRCNPQVLASLVGERSVRLGLESIQGYNPLHFAVYTDYIDVMNGGKQDYHWVDPAPAALVSSPLLDMLNVRYIVVGLGPGAEDLISNAVTAGKREVFRNQSVVVLENPDAFERAWIVHDVRVPERDGDLGPLASGKVDGHSVAFVSTALVGVDAAPVGSDAETVIVTEIAPSQLRATTRLETNGFVVFSQVYAEGWTAKVDGKSAPLVQTNHTLMGVQVPSGEHEVVLEYRPQSLRVGLQVSLISLAIWVALAAWSTSSWMRSRGQ